MQKALNYILSATVLYLVVLGCGESEPRPAITLLGSSPIDVPLNVPYNDAGATARVNSEEEDGQYKNLTAYIVTVNPVDVNVVGKYFVTYDVRYEGVSAAQKTRTVNVVSNVTPVIALLGVSPIDTPLGITYTDAGAMASDTEDGDITANITTVNPVDISTVGAYTVTYDVIDSGGEAATQVTRTVNVVANVVPVITLSGASSVDTLLGSTYIDAGATAFDSEDGDITVNIVTVNAVDTNTVGAYTVTYDVVDSRSVAATRVIRAVNVVANVAPVITLLGASSIDAPLGSSYTDAGATAFDSEDGDITADIVTVNSVDINTVGAYTVTYDVVDSSDVAASQVTRTVDVSANVAPVTTLLGASSVDTFLGFAYADAGATASDAEDGDITANIVTVNPVDINTAGTYTVTYDVVDSSDVAATQVSRTVNVISIGDSDLGKS